VTNALSLAFEGGNGNWRPLQQLLELRQPETLSYSVCLVGPQEIPDPLGHF